MKKTNVKNDRFKICRKAVFSTVWGTAWVLLGVTVFHLSLASCAVTADSVKMAQGDFTVPELQDFAPTGEKMLLLRFSKPVELADVHITDEQTGSVVSSGIRRETDDDSVVELELTDTTQAGKRYWVNGVASDKAGNSLDFSVEFTGYNERVPKLVLSEVRSEASSPKNYEFVELYAMTAGNLAGVTLLSANYGQEKIYEFPPVEVRSGEYIVVHYRKTGDEADLAMDETGDDLTASKGKQSTPGRDFWREGSEKLVNKNDVILLRERAGGSLMDALLCSEADKADWKNDALRGAAKEAHESGIWPEGAAPKTALETDRVTATRTISRQNIPEIAAADGTVLSASLKGREAWLLTTTSTATPGMPNSSVPYVEPPKKTVSQSASPAASTRSADQSKAKTTRKK
jgi:hypothetical protein